MNERIKFAVAVAAIIATLLIGYGIRSATHRCPVCPKCPELVARSHTERDSVGPRPDTARVTKPSSAIAVRKTWTMPAPEKPEISPQLDSAVIYEVVDTMPDQAIVGFSIASRDLPDRRLPDLTHTAWYLAKPDRIRIISDTLTVQLPPLPCPSRFWRDVKIGGVCLGIGAVAATSYFIFR